MAFSGKQLECVECKVSFNNREELVVHLENFCVGSKWAQPEKEIREINREIKAQNRRDNWANETIPWDEVEAYLRLTNAGKYDEKLTDKKEDLPIGRMTLYDLRDHFRKNHLQYTYLRDYMEDKHQMGIIEELKHLKRTKKDFRKTTEKPTRKKKKKNKYFIAPEDIY